MRRSVVAASAGAVLLALAPAAGAAVLPEDVARSCWFQTNGPAAPLDAGDWYTNAGTAAVGDGRLHRFQITIPAGADFPVTIRVRDAESRLGAADHDEVRNARDPTRFELFRPDGSSVRRTFSDASANGSTFTIVAMASDGPGTYLLTSETGAFAISGADDESLNDDENGFLIEVSPDGRDTSAPTDDVDVAFTAATLACTDSRSSLSLRYHVPEGTSVTRLRNFDLDAPGRVTGPLEYVAPDGSTVAGTMSANEVWNGAGGTTNGGEDTVPIAPGGEGPWTIVVFGLDASNQVAFEAYADGTQLPLSLTFLPNNVAPTATLHAPGTIDEGAPFALSFADVADTDGDLDDIRFFFDCGDAIFRGPFTAASGACVAGNDGTATVRGKVRDGNGGESSHDAQVEIANVAPAYTPPARQTVPLRPRRSVKLGRFTDPGPDAPWRVELAWGHGTARTTRLVSSTGALPALAHRFPRVGLYTVTVRVTDNREPSTGSFVVRVRRLCVVPNLKGKRLVVARRTLRARDCRVGRVTRVFSKKVRGRVISQKPKAGKVRPRGTKVKLVVSKGRRRG